MHLVSLRPQTIQLRALDLCISVATGEVIHTESAFKHSLSEIDAMVQRSGMRSVAIWHDPEGRFAECLLAVAVGDPRSAAGI